jgi:hypothetical protein
MIVLEDLLNQYVASNWFSFYDHPDWGGARLQSTPGVEDYTKYFYEHGYVVFPSLLPDGLVDSYCRYREQHDIPVEGWSKETPYLEVEELRDLCCHGPLVDRLSRLLCGDTVAVNLNLTGWVSTERNWHMDCYLNPPGIGSHYLAVWMALDDIHPDSGPFEFLPGSHHLHFLTRDKIFSQIPESEQQNPNWPKTTERFVVPAIEDWIDRTGQRDAIQQFMGKKGDVLVWHSRLIHRGSVPKVPGKIRKSLIAHYSSVRHRYDMRQYKRHKNQGYYFIL